MDTQAPTNTAPHVVAGAELLHYRPSTGRIIRCVTVVERRGDAAIVRADYGKNAGKEYPVSVDALALSA